MPSATNIHVNTLAKYLRDAVFAIIQLYYTIDKRS